MTTVAEPRPSVRERLVASADELFYEHGVHVVGIDRVLEHSGVAKASLYKHFRSKDELVREYLLRRQARREARWRKYLDRAGDEPRARLLALFDAQQEAFNEPGFRGCAFLKAAAEAAPGEAGDDIGRGYRARQLEVLTAIATSAGVQDAEALARRLILLYDGASASAHLDHRAEATADARALAEVAVDAVLA